MNQAEEKSDVENRRPIKARSSSWAQGFSAFLARTSITPNQISSISVVFAAAGAALFYKWATPIGLLLAAAAIQLRLVCNLLDGMVAMEGGKKSAVGALYNEVPDRITDSLLIVAAGYAAGIPAWGWLGALAAALTAYVRVFGGALGLVQSFPGPMAKQHRMAVLTGACVLAAVESWVWGSGSRYVLMVAVMVIALGSILTCATRLNGIAKQLRV